MKIDKREEIERFALLFGLEVEALKEIYCQIETQAIVPLEFISKIEEGDIILGGIDEFERKALCWMSMQTDDIWREIISDLVCFRVIIRLDLSGSFCFKEGGKVVRKNVEFRMEKRLSESVPINTFPL